MNKMNAGLKRLFVSSVPVLSVLLWALPLGAQPVAPAQPAAPRPPRIPPRIARSYPEDLDGNRIADALDARAGAATAAQATTVVEVELVFTEPVTQAQIDRFLAEGGTIDHVFEAISYGWVGRIPLNKVRSLPQAMGPSLILVQAAQPTHLTLLRATQTGRVRPVWATSFNNGTGYSGSTNITIAIVDSGVDESHTDLNGRRVFWQDFTTEAASSPQDYEGHGSHVAGIATGTGAASGSGTGTLLYSQHGDLSSVSSGSFLPGFIELPTSSVTWTSGALWSGGGSTTFRHDYSPDGTLTVTSFGSSSGTSPISRSDTLTASSTRKYTTELTSVGSTNVGAFAITNAVSNYPGAGDGFNKLRGVAPGCNWAGAKVFTSSGYNLNSWIDTALDTLVAGRATNLVKVINMSLESSSTDSTMRQKVNTAVDNGIVVVVSAGNNGASSGSISDPGRAANAITVAAANDVNQLTSYTSLGVTSLDTTSGSESDYKPDLMAPGGSQYYTDILSVDSNNGDGTSLADQRANDYTTMEGTSMAAPFVSGCAALLINAMESNGYTWDFNSNTDPLLVKMLLNATATESNTNRESNANNPTLQRAASGANNYPVGKDQYEGYGMVNPDAAIEAITKTLTLNVVTNDTLGGSTTNRRAWARQLSLTAGQTITFTLTNPAAGDFDLYLYQLTPGTYGKPTILASSTSSGVGVNESITYNPSTNLTAFVVVKCISGSGTFYLLPACSNDNFTNAFTIVDTFTGATNFIFNATTTVSGNSTGYTTETGEPSELASGHSAWYVWHASYTGTAYLDAGKHAVQTYTGSSVSALTSVGSGIDSSTETFSCTAGTTYYLAVFGGAGPYTLTMTAQGITTLPLTNSTTIVSNSTGIGASTPYPCQITLNGVTQHVVKVTATLEQVTHTDPEDFHILLVDPATNHPTLLMADAGGNTGMTNVTLTFDSSASSYIPCCTTPTSGSYLPANYFIYGDGIPSPAPSTPYGTNMAVFNGESAGGTWSLYVDDRQYNGTSGNLNGGWALNFTFDQPPTVYPGTSSASYTEGASPTRLQSAAMIMDSDNSNFINGNLTVQVISNNFTEDVLSITNQGSASGKIGLSGTNVTYGGTTIGYYSGGGGTNALVIYFTSTAATINAAQQLIASITYSNSSSNPSSLTRTIQFTLNDGNIDGNGSFTESLTVVPVNTAPTLTLYPTNVFTEHGAIALVASNSTIADPDNANFNGGSLTVALNGVDGADQLLISSQGTSAGQIGVSGSSVSYGGTTFGNFSGGSSGNALVINFTNTSATLAAVQQLVDRIGFTNSACNPNPVSPRYVSFTLADGSGGSVTTTNTLGFVTVNDPPTISYVHALTGALENKSFIISNLTITANSDMHDCENGYYGYRIVSVTSGTLTINGTGTVTPGSTSFWPPDYVVWTPATNTYGTNVNAFVIQGFDGQLLSTNTVQVMVAVAHTNQAPVVANPIATQNATYGTAFSYTFAANVFSDPDSGTVLTYSASGLPTGIGFTNSTRTFGGTPTQPGTNTITLVATDNGSPALSATNQFSFIVAKAPLSVTATSTNRAYGSINPVFKGTLTGVVNNDNLSASYACAATTNSPVGSYAITATLNDPNSRLANYTVTTNNGVLTINTAPLTVTANNTNRTYGDTNPVFSASYAGFVNAQTLASSGITGSPSLTTTATTNSGAGTYIISVTNGTLASTNYSFVFTNGTLTVNPAPLQVTANDATRLYGAANPAFTVSYAGFVNGQSLTNSDVTGAPDLFTLANTNAAVGSYDIVVLPGTLAATNYSFSFSGGSLTVTAEPLVVTPDNASRAYGQPNPAFTGTLVGLVNNDPITASYATLAATNSPVGTYPITATLNDPDSLLSNYSVTTNTGTLSVTNGSTRSNYSVSALTTNSIVALAQAGTVDYTFTDPNTGLNVVIALTLTPTSTETNNPTFSLLDGGVHLGVDSGTYSGDGNWVDWYETLNFSASLVSASAGIATNSIQFGLLGLGIRPGSSELQWSSPSTSVTFVPSGEALAAMDTNIVALAGRNYTAQLRTGSDGSYQLSDLGSPGQGLVLEASFYVGTNYAVAPTLAAPGVTNNQFQLTISGTAGASYIVQAATNLATPIWTAVSTNAAPFTFRETNVYSQRFYRAVAQ